MRFSLRSARELTFWLICGSYRVWIRVLAGTREWPAPQPSEPTVYFHCAPEGRNYRQNGGRIFWGPVGGCGRDERLPGPILLDRGLLAAN